MKHTYHLLVSTLFYSFDNYCTGETDVRNFDTEFTRERAIDSVVTNHLTGTMAAKSDFQNFTYTGSGDM